MQSGLTCKLFFVCLYMSVTSIDKQFVEKARTISLTILPLMFPQVAAVLHRRVTNKFLGRAGPLRAQAMAFIDGSPMQHALQQEVVALRHIPLLSASSRHSMPSSRSASPLAALPAHRLSAVSFDSERFATALPPTQTFSKP